MVLYRDIGSRRDGNASRPFFAAAWCYDDELPGNSKPQRQAAPQLSASNGITCTKELSRLHKIPGPVGPPLQFYDVLSLRQSEHLKFSSRGTGPENPITLIRFGAISELEANEILPLKSTELFLA